MRVPPQTTGGDNSYTRFITFKSLYYVSRLTNEHMSLLKFDKFSIETYF